MVASELTVRLSQYFGAYIASDPSLLAEATSICKHYNVTPEDLFYKWEAFAINNKLPKSEPFTIEHARELRKIIATSVNATMAAGVAAADHAQTPLKPSSALNRGRIAGDFSAMLGIKSTPNKGTAAIDRGVNANANANANSNPNAFQTPVRALSSSIHSPFGGHGATPASASAYKPPIGAMGARDGDVHMSGIDSPIRSVPGDVTAAASSSSTSKRAQFSIVESLNEHHALTGSGSQLGVVSSSKKSSRVALATATNVKAWNYRYMYEKKGERSQVLDERIDEFASMLRSAYAIDESEEFGDPSLASQEAIWVVGRICAALPAPQSSAGEAMRAKAKAKAAASGKTNGDVDGTLAFGLPKLAETGVVLESSRMMGSGNRTPLVFDKGCIVKHTPQDAGTGGAATTLSLFPGQMVLCRGINAGADKFSVSEICLPPPLPLAVHTVDDALDRWYATDKLNGTALNVVAACAPYTDEADLHFAAWHRLMDALESGGLPSSDSETSRRGVPDTLVLCGPFISSKHAHLAFSTDTPAELFIEHFTRRLNELVTRYPATTVVMIPSTDDILNVHSAYPQPGFSKDDAVSLRLPKQVKCLPNPSVLFVNELVLGVTSVDVLADIKSEEMVTRIQASPNATASAASAVTQSVASKNKETNTRWSRSLLSQRSFYPLFPPPTQSGLSYDTCHSHLLGFPAVTPDLLILPSQKANPFIRVVNSATVVQPGSVAHSTVACIQIRPLPRDYLQSRSQFDTINATLYDRARIDIVTI